MVQAYCSGLGLGLQGSVAKILTSDTVHFRLVVIGP